MEIFSHLEEKNLFLIIRCQDGERQLEEKQVKEKEIRADFTKEIGILKANEGTNFARIQKTEQEKNALSGLTEDSEGKSLDSVT